MGSCATKTQHVCVIPPITEYRDTIMQTTLKSTSCSYRGLFIESSDMHQTDNDLDFAFKERHHILLRQRFHESAPCSIISCISVKRIILLFEYYAFLERRYKSCECHYKLLEYLNTEYLYLINDYHHIIKRHINKNNIEFELLYDFVNKYITPCDVTLCQHFVRHKRYGSRTHCIQFKDEEEIAIRFYVDLLDSVHCFLLHSFDDGFRLKQKFNHHNNNELFLDYEMVQLKAYLGDKTKDIFSILRDRMEYNKFHTNYEYQSIIKSKLSSISEMEMVCADNNCQMEQYGSFGDVLDIEISAKYDNLKEEIVSNRIYRLNLLEYDCIMYKAQKLLHSSSHIKSMRYNGMNEAINVCAIFCVICYSDYSLFSYHLKCRNQSMNELCTYFNILRSTITKYGSCLNDTKISKLYTSISFASFSSFCCVFNGITSMTTQISVITSYCIHNKHSKNGVILEFDPFEQENKLKCFDLSIFSEFGNENEIIFCGNNEFKFSSIKIIANNQDYRNGIGAIQIFMDAMNGKLRRKYPPNITQSHLKIISRLCDGNNGFPHYINQMFCNLCNTQIQVHIDLYSLNTYYRPLIAILCHSDCLNLIRFDDICNSIFTECQYIVVDESGEISIKYLHLLLQILKKIKSKQITIEIRSTKIHLKLIEKSRFQNINWSIHVDTNHLRLTKQ